MKHLFLLLTLLSFSLTALAQQKVTGKVKDSSGEPVIGASVVVKGNNTMGTITDFDGNFMLDIPAILVHYNKCVNEGNVPKSSQDENYRRARRAFLIGYDRSVPKLRQASHCTGCNQCNPHCPQSIDIPKELHRIDAYVEQLKQETL